MKSVRWRCVKSAQVLWGNEYVKTNQNNKPELKLRENQRKHRFIILHLAALTEAAPPLIVWNNQSFIQSVSYMSGLLPETYADMWYSMSAKRCPRRHSHALLQPNSLSMGQQRAILAMCVKSLHGNAEKNNNTPVSVWLHVLRYVSWQWTQKVLRFVRL